MLLLPRIGFESFPFSMPCCFSIAIMARSRDCTGY
jgi:hypothetical protein